MELFCRFVLLLDSESVKLKETLDQMMTLETDGGKKAKIYKDLQVLLHVVYKYAKIIFPIFDQF
jgi:hypothetical protein